MAFDALFPLFGKRSNRRIPGVRRYRSMRRYIRATFSNDRQYAAYINGLPPPPVRQRNRYKIWR